MRIITYLVVGAGEADRYLPQALERIKPLVDNIAVAANRTDKKTLRLLKEYNCKIYKDDREWGRAQHWIKQDFYKKIAELKPNWILALDADEIFDERLTRQDLEQMADSEIYDAYSFYFIQLWDKGYNPDLGFWNVRFFRYLQGEWKNAPLHCGLAPQWAYKTTWYAPFIILHYGLKNASDRQNKIKRYALYDKDAKYILKWYYDQLKHGQAQPLDINKIIKSVVAEVSSYKPRQKKLMPTEENKQKFYYFKRKKDGVILDIPERDFKEMMLKKDEFDLAEEKPVYKREFKVVLNENNEAKEVGTDDKKTFVCDVCGFVAKTDAGLKAHKRKHKK